MKASGFETDLRLKRLLLSRYGLFDGEVEIEFSGSGIDLIIGDNESGKSTLMDGILSVLFGTKREERGDLTPWSGSSGGQGTVEIETDNILRIQREVDSQHTTVTANPEEAPLELFNDKASPQGKKELTHYLKIIGEKVGVRDRDLLESLTFVRQNQMETELGEKIREIISGSGKGDYKKAIDKLIGEADSLTADVPWAKKKRQDKQLEKLEHELYELRENLEMALRVREEGGDIEGELSRSGVERKELEAVIKIEKDKQKDLIKYNESLEEYDRALENEKKLSGEIEDIGKQRSKLEELEEKRKDGRVAALSSLEGSPEEELKELKSLAKEVETVKNKIESLNDTGGDVERELTAAWKVALTVAAAALGVLIGQMYDSTHLSSLLAVLLAVITLLILTKLKFRFGRSGETAGRLKQMEDNLDDHMKRQDELKLKFDILLNNNDISELLKVLDDMRKWDTISETTAEFLKGKKPLEELEESAKRLRQTIRLKLGELESLEEKIPELLKTERKQGDSKALEAEQKQKVEELSGKLQSLRELAHESEKDLAERRGRGIGNVDLLEREIAGLEEKIEEMTVESDALKLAIHTLEESVEEFQETHHGRLGERISEWFGRFTGGKYSGVTLDDDWAPMITTSGGKRIEPEILSTGARDQLYFAMRLSLAELMSKDVNLPIVLDDPFVHYDDKRLETSKNILTEISREHQVILFTHSPSYAGWGNVALDLNDYWEKLK